MTSIEYSSPISGQQKPWPNWLGISRSTWAKIGILTFLSICLFWPNLRRLWYKTNWYSGEANWGHSMVVPLIGLYYLYVNREELLKSRMHTTWSGLPILLGGLLIWAYGIWPGQNDWVWDFGMVMTIFGLVSMLLGWQAMKIAWFPVLFLICAIPWPGLVYSYLAMPLQRLAAAVAVITLQVTGVEAYNQGTKIIIGGFGGEYRSLNVAEACAGMRSLMTFISVAAAIAFLSARPLWQKAVITVSAIPIAIACNVMRVAGQGLLDHYVSQEWSQSFAHQFVGLVMLAPAFFLILLVGWVLDHLIIEEADDENVAAAAAARTVQALKAAPRIVPPVSSGGNTVVRPAVPRPPATLPPAAVPPRPTAVVPPRPPRPVPPPAPAPSPQRPPTPPPTPPPAGNKERP